MKKKLWKKSTGLSLIINEIENLTQNLISSVTQEE